jgi:ABC-2 type transport system permease protein
MKAYLALISARFRTLLQYRASAWAGFGTQAFFGFVRVMIFTAFYQSSKKVQPMNLGQVINYIWLGQAMFAMLPWSMDRDVADSIRTGNIAYELVRPIDLYRSWFCRAFAIRTAPTLLRAAPLILLAALVLPLLGANDWALTAPASLPAGFIFLLALTGALLLACSFTVLMSISLMWTISADGIANLLPVTVWVLSGIVIPIPFYPEWLQPVLKYLPFRGLMDIPLRIYVGNIANGEALSEIGLQLFWIVTLIGLGRWLLSRGIKRIVVQGG